MMRTSQIKVSKNIADDNYFYLRSCIRQNYFPGAENVFLDFMRNKLGKNIVDSANHTSCTGIGYHCDIVPFDTYQTMVARQFALMTELGLKNAAVSCITSFGGYNEVMETWKEFPEEKAKACKNLKKATGRNFEIPENIAHTCDIIYKFRHQIAELAKYKLVNKHTGQPLNVVDHIGCHYAKIFPEKGVGGAEKTTVLSALAEAWGGKSVDYPERRHCCGFGFRHYMVKNNRSYSLSNSKKKFESMEPYHPDLIVTNCPGCNMFLDKWQYALGKIEGKTYSGDKNGIPVLSSEELAALVLGYNPWDIGLQMHQVDVEPLLEKIGFDYNPDEKYLDANRNFMGKPEFTGCLD